MSSKLEDLSSLNGKANERTSPASPASTVAALQTPATPVGPMRAFEQQLATMAASFTPMKELHSEVAQVIQSFHGQLAELVRSFEPAKLCKQRMAELAMHAGCGDRAAD
jgi:hypothetical protein